MTYLAALGESATLTYLTPCIVVSWANSDQLVVSFFSGRLPAAESGDTAASSNLSSGPPILSLKLSNWCQWRSHYKRSVTNGKGNGLFKTFYWLPLKNVFHRKSKYRNNNRRTKEKAQKRGIEGYNDKNSWKYTGEVYYKLSYLERKIKTLWEKSNHFDVHDDNSFNYDWNVDNCCI